MKGKLANVIHVVLSLDMIDIFCEFIACMSPFKKCQHTTVTISISLLYKFCCVHINIDSPEVTVVPNHCTNNR